MFKTLRTPFSLLLVALLFSSCAKKQSPTPVDTITGSQFGSFPTNSSSYDGDIVPPTFDTLEGFGNDAEILEPRTTMGDTGMSDGMFNGKQKITGVLPSVFYGFNSSAISVEERPKLQQAADYLAQNPANGILIEAHCDWYGTEEYNLALGDRRANSVRDFLVTLGVDSSRIDTVSKGSLQATPGLSKEQSGQDRRADLIVLE